MMRILFVLVAAHCLCKVSAAGSSPIKGACKQDNDYVKAECGVKDKSLTCCSHKQHCIGPIKPKKGDDKYVCSQERKLAGSKVMKVVLIPMIFMIMDILFIVFMVIKFDIKSNHVTKLCVAAIAVSWPMLLSSKAHFGIYSGFLALLVAFMSTKTDFPSWMLRIVWAMMVFQVVLLFGPNETFHVPNYQQSLGLKTDLVTDLLKLKEKDCDTHYESFFKFVSIEKEAVNVNPDAEYFGFCTEDFIGFVQAMAMIQGIVWMVTVMVSVPTFLQSGKDEPINKKLILAIVAVFVIAAIS